MVYTKKSGSAILRQKEKIYLNNPDIYKAIANEIGIDFNTGSIREIFFIKMIKNSNNKIFYSQAGDFEVNGKYFEIGGKNKQDENRITLKFNFLIIFLPVFI